MSSYLNIYLKPTVKEGENPKEPMYLMSFSRCNEIYSIMIDELIIKENIKTAKRNHERYLKSRKKDLQSIIDLFSKSISQAEDRHTIDELYEAFSAKLREISDNTDFEEEDNEYFDDLEYALKVAESLQLIIINLQYNSDFCGMCANFD